MRKKYTLELVCKEAIEIHAKKSAVLFFFHKQLQVKNTEVSNEHVSVDTMVFI